jgi:hypothetical protein
MTRRVVIGPRANGDKGVFVSPAGVDAFTATDAQLLLSITDRIPQLLQMGFLSSSTTIFMGLSSQPFVLLFNSANMSAIPGYTQVGPARPAPIFNTDTQSYADLSGGTSMFITCGQRTSYQVYNYPL